MNTPYENRFHSRSDTHPIIKAWQLRSSFSIKDEKRINSVVVFIFCMSEDLYFLADYHYFVFVLYGELLPHLNFGLTLLKSLKFGYLPQSRN